MQAAIGGNGEINVDFLVPRMVKKLVSLDCSEQQLIAQRPPMIN
jgi:hypothetical protein